MYFALLRFENLHLQLPQKLKTEIKEILKKSYSIENCTEKYQVGKIKYNRPKFILIEGSLQPELNLISFNLKSNPLA